jgi:methylisocitrate lyase
MPIVTAATGLRRALEDPKSFIVAPGVYDGLSARIALSLGFDALYMVSSQPTQLHCGGH